MILSLQQKKNHKRGVTTYDKTIYFTIVLFLFCCLTACPPSPNSGQQGDNTDSPTDGYTTDQEDLTFSDGTEAVLKVFKLDGGKKIYELKWERNGKKFHFFGNISKRTDICKFIVDGDTINGNFILHGPARNIPKSQTSKFVESFIDRVRLNGDIQYTWLSGNTFEGTFVNGGLDSVGKFTWKEGDSYTGSFKRLPFGQDPAQNKIEQILPIKETYFSHMTGKGMYMNSGNSVIVNEMQFVKGGYLQGNHHTLMGGIRHENAMIGSWHRGECASCLKFNELLPLPLKIFMDDGQNNSINLNQLYMDSKFQPEFAEFERLFQDKAFEKYNEYSKRLRGLFSNLKRTSCEEMYQNVCCFQYDSIQVEVLTLRDYLDSDPLHLETSGTLLMENLVEDSKDIPLIILNIPGEPIAGRKTDVFLYFLCFEEKVFVIDFPLLTKANNAKV